MPVAPDLYLHLYPTLAFPLSPRSNPWFRIRVHKDVPGKLRFEHPTMAGQTPGGWMTHPGDWRISRTGASFYKTGEFDHFTIDYLILTIY